MQMDHCEPAAATSQVVEFPLAWPGAAMHHEGPACHPTAGGSTHEIVFDPKDGTHCWVSGQNYDCLARIALDGSATYHPMPAGSLPHGLSYDPQGRLWVTFEGLGELARIEEDGGIAERIDVRLYPPGAQAPFNPRPHGLRVASDGALWFTGKLSNSVGRVANGAVEHIQLPTIGAVPIYAAEGPDGAMWCTELTGNMIARVTATAAPVEYPIPTANSRPIAIALSPDGESMWFSQEAGGKVARIGMDGTITEWAVPLTDRNAILAALTFDTQGALWTQMYVSPPVGQEPTANDYIVRLGPELLSAAPGDLSGVPVSYFKAPSKGTGMHRVVQGPDGNIWFTELAINRVGRVNL